MQGGTRPTTEGSRENIGHNVHNVHVKNRFEHIELPAKLLDYFLRSNESNINQIRIRPSDGMIFLENVLFCGGGRNRAGYGEIFGIQNPSCNCCITRQQGVGPNLNQNFEVLRRRRIVAS